MSDRPEQNTVRADHGPLEVEADFDLDPPMHIFGRRLTHSVDAAAKRRDADLGAEPMDF